MATDTKTAFTTLTHSPFPFLSYWTAKDKYNLTRPLPRLKTLADSSGNPQPDFFSGSTIPEGTVQLTFTGVNASEVAIFEGYLKTVPDEGVADSEFIVTTITGRTYTGYFSHISETRYDGMNRYAFDATLECSVI